MEFSPGCAARIISATGKPICLVEWEENPTILANGLSALPELLYSAMRLWQLVRKMGTCPFCHTLDGEDPTDCPSWLAMQGLVKAGLLRKREGALDIFSKMQS